jgi:hypothetical protein
MSDEARLLPPLGLRFTRFDVWGTQTEDVEVRGEQYLPHLHDHPLSSAQYLPWPECDPLRTPDGLL